MGPSFHQLAPLVEQIATPVGRFGLILDHMSKRGLADLVWKVRAFSGPIPECGTEPMHRRCLRRSFGGVPFPAP